MEVEGCVTVFNDDVHGIKVVVNGYNDCVYIIDYVNKSSFILYVSEWCDFLKEIRKVNEDVRCRYMDVSNPEESKFSFSEDKCVEEVVVKVKNAGCHTNILLLRKKKKNGRLRY